MPGSERKRLRGDDAGGGGKRDRLRKRICELEDLEEGWDSYGSSTISPAACDALRVLLDNVAFVPIVDGRIQVEFHCLGIDVEATVGTDGKFEDFGISRYIPAPEAASMDTSDGLGA